MKGLISNNAPIIIKVQNDVPIVIFGWEFLSTAQLNIINNILTHSDVSDTDSGVRMIAFKNETIDECGLGVSHPESGSIVIDLAAHFVKAMRIIEANTEIDLNIFSLYHIELLKTLIHEIHHITAGHIGYENKEEEEELAEKWAETTIKHLAIHSNIESGNYIESSAFSAMLSNEFKSNTEMKNEFKENQLHMMNNGITLHMKESEENEEYSINSIKTLYAYFIGENPTEGEWTKTNTVTATTASAAIQPTATIQQSAHHTETANEAHEVPWETESQEEEVPMFAGAETSSAPTTTVQSTVVHHEEQTPIAVYPPTHLTPEQTKAVIFEVYNKIYNKIFNECGYTGAANPTAAFNNSEAVCHPIQLTDLEKQVVVKMDCVDQNGRWCPNMPTVNGLQGSILKNTKMPAFTIYINDNGMEQIRKLIPQNPGKVVNGQYTKLALQAQAGSKILHVFNGNKFAGQNYMCKCIDGTWQV